MKDKLFEWYPIGRDILLSEIIETVLLQINSSRKSTRGITSSIKKKEKHVSTHLLNALYLSYFSIPKMAVAIKMTAKSYSRDTYGYKNVRKVIDSLDVLSFINIKKGSEYAGKVTRVWASHKLEKLFKDLGFRWRYYPVDRTKEIIIVRDRVLNKDKKNRRKKYTKITVPTPKTKLIAIQKENLFRINEFLSQHCIALDLENKDLVTIQQEIKVEERTSKSHFFWEEKPIYALNFSLVHLRRIYSRGVTYFGGRFYGGWWQGLPSRYRPHITIDGYKTAEVDYSTMSLRLLYSKEGIKVPEKQDLYDIGLKGSKKYLTRARELIKIYINALLNDESRRYRLKPGELDELKLSHKELKDLVRKYHQSIVHLFGTGVGLELMYLDSMIADELMLFFRMEGIVLLPIHDSFFIRAGYELSLKSEMMIIFKRLMDSYILVKSTGPKLREHFNKPPPPSNDPSEGIVRGVDTWDLVIKDTSNEYYSIYHNAWMKWRVQKNINS